jgi:uncharacterized protein GlcG (DUF336 family)
MLARATLALGLLCAFAAPAGAQQVPEYGPNVTLDQARRVVAAAEGEAKRNQWPVAIAVVDTAGNLVLFQRLDNTMTASLKLAVDKAASAATYRRPTKYFQDALAQGGERLGVLTLAGVCASEGGIPLYVGGKIVGAVGVSGVRAVQDQQIAEVGSKAVK